MSLCREPRPLQGPPSADLPDHVPVTESGQGRGGRAGETKVSEKEGRAPAPAGAAAAPFLGLGVQPPRLAPGTCTDARLAAWPGCGDQAPAPPTPASRTAAGTAEPAPAPVLSSRPARRAEAGEPAPPPGRLLRRPLVGGPGSLPPPESPRVPGSVGWVRSGRAGSVYPERPREWEREVPGACPRARSVLSHTLPCAVCPVLSMEADGS